MEIYLASVQGFCAGVARAIQIVDKALAKYGIPLYVYHDIVHNNAVIQEFREKGVVFVEDISGVPFGSPVVFSAHGVSPSIFQKADERNLRIIDATCPLVKKIHIKAQKLSETGCQIILIGHKGHQEIIGTAGYIDPGLIHYVQKTEDVQELGIERTKPLAYLTQTTLSVSDTSAIINKIKELYPQVSVPVKGDICFATQNRQDAVLELAKVCDIIVICGSAHSSNSNRLKEVAVRAGVSAYLVDSANEFSFEWLKGRKKIGISSGASVPEDVVNKLIDSIKERYPDIPVNRQGSIKEKMHFSLPEI
ncbi:4-hydroxy-3-methylbut-2-enyl diphosphate reductase [Candidatus Margulisiibacteriota bacterium]